MSTAGPAQRLVTEPIADAARGPTLRLPRLVVLVLVGTLLGAGNAAAGLCSGAGHRVPARWEKAVVSPAVPGPTLTLVASIDATYSVTNTFRATAKESLAEAVPRLLEVTPGRIFVYVRRIDYSSGSDEAAVASYHIDAEVVCDNPFDHRCRLEREASLQRRVTQAGRIAAEIRGLDFTPKHKGTLIDAAFGAAGDILAGTSGLKWIYFATDLRQSSAGPLPPAPRVVLTSARVSVLFACRQPLALCQARQRRWKTKLVERDHAAAVRYLSPQQAQLLFQK